MMGVTSLLSLYPVGKATVIRQHGSAADDHHRRRDCKHNLLHIIHPEFSFASWTTVLHHGPVLKLMLLRWTGQLDRQGLCFAIMG